MDSPDPLGNPVETNESHNLNYGLLLTIMTISTITCIFSSYGIKQWRKRCFRSYDICTQLILWSIPTTICAYYRLYWFIIIWIMFAAITALVITKSKNAKENKKSRALYNVFHTVYALSFRLCCVGCLFITMTYLGLNNVFHKKTEQWIFGSLMFIFCGLYFGSLWRDVVNYCTSEIAASHGFYTREGLPFKQFNRTVCTLCGEMILIDSNGHGVYEKMCNMNCGHIHHDFCVKVWSMVGGKKTCPYCKDSLYLFENPWFWPCHVYGELLGMTRWLIIWTTLTVTLTPVITWLVISLKICFSKRK